MLGLLFYWAGVQVELLEVFNKIFLGVFLASWVSANIWFLCRESFILGQNSRGKKRYDEMSDGEDEESVGANERGERPARRVSRSASRSSLHRQSVTLWKRTSSISNVTLPNEDEENTECEENVDSTFSIKEIVDADRVSSRRLLPHPQ